MKIEYTVSGDLTVQGNGWICYSRDRFSWSTIFDELLDVIKSAQNKTYSELKETVREAYSNKQSKSKADIYYDVLEICKPNKTLPHIWIIENSVS